MTAPRHEIVFARNYIEIALRTAGVPLSVSGGVFYGQCMQRALEAAIGNGADIAVTVDFDSMFTGAHVTRLLQSLVSYDYDAVAALQCRRGKPFPLMTIEGETKQVITSTPFPVTTAHFGLTAINLNKLKDIPKPWFHSKPDENGQWGDNRMDEDIWFWDRWKTAGLKVAMDPNVRIGHLEEMVTMFDENMNPQHVYPNTWAEEQYTPEARRGTCVFVGANVGGETIQKLIDRHEHTILFEPQPFAAEKLRETYAKNERVEIVEAAVGESNCGKTLTIYNELGLSSSLGTMTQEAVELYSEYDLSERGRVDVEVVNLFDWLFERYIEEIETLIIDAQGMDLTILKTLEPLITAGKIQHIEAEADGEGFTHYSGLPSNSEADQREYMSQFGYDFELVNGRLDKNPDLRWTLRNENENQTVETLERVST